MGDRDVARGSAADALNAKHCPSRNSFSGMPKTREQTASGDVSMPRSHRPPFTMAPVADSQRSSDPLLFIMSARADSQRRWLPPSIFLNTMDDPNDLVLGMFALAVTALMLVAGRTLPRDKARPTGDPHAAGLDSNIIHPVTWLPARKRILTRRGVQ
jgi:hypothetical protein